MSKMSDIYITICEMLESGLYSDAAIAAALNIPVEWVTMTRLEFLDQDKYFDYSQE